ncbi:MAG: hypothetical protein D6814_08045, partial [Calditrichaeota bacterium]
MPNSIENDPQFERLKSRLQQNPDSLLFARVAENLLNRGQVEEAVRVCEEGIRKHPYYVTGHMVLGKCYLQKKLFDLAEKEFKRVLLFDPKYIAAHKFYGDLMREVGWENTCEMSYRKILQIDPLDRSAREMIETLERVKPGAEQGSRESLGAEPAEPAEDLASHTPAPEEAPLADPFASLDEPTETSVPEPGATPLTEQINIDDDLFADVSPGAPEEAPEEHQYETTEDKTQVTEILEDIFEEEGPADTQINDTGDQEIEQRA